MVDELKDRLRTAMTAAGVSEHDLAKHLQITYQAVKKVLDGKTVHFSVPNHFAVAHLLNVDPEWLASGGQPGETRSPEPSSVVGFYRSPFSEDLTNELNTQQPPVTAWIESVVTLLLHAPKARQQNVVAFAQRNQG